MACPRFFKITIAVAPQKRSIKTVSRVNIAFGYVAHQNSQKKKLEKPTLRNWRERSRKMIPHPTLRSGMMVMVPQHTPSSDLRIEVLLRVCPLLPSSQSSQSIGWRGLKSEATATRAMVKRLGPRLTPGQPDSYVNTHSEKDEPSGSELIGGRCNSLYQ